MRGLMALVGAVEFAGVSICVAAPASAVCDYQLYAQYCDGPLLPDGTFQRCQVAYGQTYPYVPTTSRCYPVDPRQPWPMFPLGQPKPSVAMTGAARGNPGGLGIAMAGAATIVLGLFLPFNEPTGPFSWIKDNTLIESGGWILLLLALAVAAGAARAWMKPDEQLWLVPLIASVVVGGWITLLAVNEEWRTF